jgi:RNA polymerase sigma-70 factor, ECF subfamily
MTSLPRGVSTDGSPTDVDLCMAVMRGDEAAFRLLYRRHTPRLRRVVGRILGPNDDDIEDTLQETWVRAVRRLSRFLGESALSTWLCGIAVRVSGETLRRRHRWRVVADAPPDDIAARQTLDTERLDLETAVAELPERARTVVVLHDIEGFTHEEIARHFGIAVGTSKAQLSRAHQTLRLRLGGTIS